MKKPKWYPALLLGLVLVLSSSIVACAKPEASVPSPEPSSAPPVIVKFTATPAEISAGESATLAWNVTEARTVSMGEDIGTIPAVGMKEVSPAETSTYTLTATNDAATITESLTVLVVEAPTEAEPPPSPPPEEPAPLVEPDDSFIVWSDQSRAQWAVGTTGGRGWTSCFFEGTVKNAHSEWSLKNVRVSLRRVDTDEEVATVKVRVIRPGQTGRYYKSVPMSRQPADYQGYYIHLSYEWQPPSD